MGFRYRKSISLGGGFRINLSKSGIGYSWGTKGFRVSRTARGTTRRTYSIPGTGLSYVDETGSRNRNSNRRSDSRQRNLPEQRKNPFEEQVIESAKIQDFKETEEENISDAIERTIKLNFLGTLMILTVVLVLVHPAFILIPIVGIILKIAAHTLGRIKLEYSFDAEKQEEHTRRIDAWELLADGKREWQILSEKYNVNRKENAGASRDIKRVECKIHKGHPYYIRTNVDTIQIDLAKKEKLIVLPDKVFFVRKRKIGAIDYSDFRISVSSTRFIETNPIPQDAHVIDYTWQFVNKNGTPDQRYKNNRQIPVCLYGDVFLRSASGLNIELMISNNQNARDFEVLIR